MPILSAFRVLNLTLPLPLQESLGLPRGSEVLSKPVAVSQDQFQGEEKSWADIRTGA
jgi:hypothetical protein